MALSKIRNNTFHRIGDRYANYFDLDHFLGRSSMDNFELTRPKRNLKKAADIYTIEVALPGFDKDEIAVFVENNTLYVKAMKEESENYKDLFLRKEFHTDTQSRDFKLSEKIDQRNIRSRFRNGVLHIELPKRELSEKEVVRQVNVS